MDASKKQASQTHKDKQQKYLLTGSCTSFQLLGSAFSDVHEPSVGLHVILQVLCIMDIFQVHRWFLCRQGPAIHSCCQHARQGYKALMGLGGICSMVKDLLIVWIVSLAASLQGWTGACNARTWLL
jgi:hypothetical protein